MAVYPGTKPPRREFPKTNDHDGDDDGTRLRQSPGTKCIKCDDDLSFTRGDVSDVGKAPTSRVYTRDYKKVGREPDDVDLVSPALGKAVFRI